MYYIIYETTNLVNGKTYRGCHKTDNIEDGYLGSGTLLFKAIKKYGKESFNRITLEFCSNETDMYEIEKFYVDEDYVNRKDTYNIRCGGLGGRLHQHIIDIISNKLRVPKSEETKERMRQAHLGTKRSDETRKKMSESSKNRPPVSYESREKMSSKAKSRKNNACDTIWINDGVTDRRIGKDSIIEDGWVRGRCKK